MPMYRRPRRPRRPFAASLPVLSKKKKRALIALLILLPIAFFIFEADRHFREMSAEIALSDASDVVTYTINNAVMEKLSSGQYPYDYFVTLEKDAEGRVSAITTNMSRVNEVAAALLKTVIDATNNGVLDVNIPLGNLSGVSIFLGRGPAVPVRIIMLTSSFSDFQNQLTSAGINQTKHQIILELAVDIDVLIPWQIMSTRVVSRILIAETIIVGSVPNTYFVME